MTRQFRNGSDPRSPGRGSGPRPAKSPRSCLLASLMTFKMRAAVPTAYMSPSPGSSVRASRCVRMPMTGFSLGDGFFDELDALPPAHVDWNDRTGEEHRVTQRQNRDHIGDLDWAALIWGSPWASASNAPSLFTLASAAAWRIPCPLVGTGLPNLITMRPMIVPGFATQYPRTLLLAVFVGPLHGQDVVATVHGRCHQHAALHYPVKFAHFGRRVRGSRRNRAHRPSHRERLGQGISVDDYLRRERF